MPDATASPTEDPGPLRAAHTPNFPSLCGVCVVDLRRGETIAVLKFESGVQEVFAVALLPRRFPDLINDDEKLLESSFVVPTECLGDVAATVRAA